MWQLENTKKDQVYEKEIGGKQIKRREVEREN
jgi:hypothetical protein